MPEPTRPDPRLLARERLIARYVQALDVGRFDTVAEVLRAAERDPALAAALREVDEALSQELPERSFSSNHRPRSKERITTMTALTKPLHTAPRRAPGRPAAPLTLAAAVCALALLMFGVLLPRLAPPDGPTMNGVALQGAGSEGECIAVVSRTGGANLFAAPGIDAQVIRRLPSNAGVRVMGTAFDTSGSSEVWVLVTTLDEQGALTGWLRADQVAGPSDTANCPTALPGVQPPIVVTATFVPSEPTPSQIILLPTLAPGAVPADANPNPPIQICQVQAQGEGLTIYAATDSTSATLATIPPTHAVLVASDALLVAANGNEWLRVSLFNQEVGAALLSALGINLPNQRYTFDPDTAVEGWLLLSGDVRPLVTCQPMAQTISVSAATFTATPTATTTATATFTPTATATATFTPTATATATATATPTPGS